MGEARSKVLMHKVVGKRSARARLLRALAEEKDIWYGTNSDTEMITTCDSLQISS